MNVDLGNYAWTVLSAYAVTLILLLGLVGVTLWQAGRVRRALDAQESRMSRDG